MSPEQAAVKQWHEQVVGLKLPTKPTMPSPTRLGYRVSHLDEEHQELAEAIHGGDFAGMAQELCDVVYVAYGLACEMGIDLEPFFAEVHAANMRKKGGGRRADGKMLKPKGWKGPDIAGVLLRIQEAAA